MPNYTASVDAGNGGVKAVLAKSKGYTSLYQPSVRAAASGDTLGLSGGAIAELDYNYADWYGNRYVIGDDVGRVTRRALERHMGAGRYGNEFHQFLVAHALATLGVSTGNVNLTLFAPPGLYNEAKPEIQARFNDPTIQLKNDKKPRSWHYSSVTVLPEGMGAAACFVLDDNGDYVPSDVLAGQVVILDIGAHTLDALLLTDGNFNPESLQSATWENSGTHTHVREPMLKTIKKQGADFDSVTVDDVDRVIRAGAESGDYTLTAAGYDMNLKPLLDKHRERYAEWISNNIIDGQFNRFRGIRSAILVGGAGLVMDYLQSWYGDKLLDTRRHKTTAKLHPVDMNAVGGLRFALATAKEAK